MKFARLIATFCLSIACSAAGAQSFVTDPEQVIGTIEAFGSEAGLELEFDNPARTSDFDVFFTDAGSSFATCVRVPAGPFLCLDETSKTVKRFDGSPPPLASIFSCNDPALDFNTRKETCTAYSFGMDSHFIAGLGNGKSFNLQRVYADTACANPLQWTPGLCAEQLYTGRPLLQSLKFFEGEAAEDLGLGGPCAVGLEQRSDALCFPVPAAAEPIMLADKKRWGVKGQESLQDIDVLQIGNPVSGEVDNYAVVTSTAGRILAAKIGDNSASIEAFDISSVDLPAMQCNFDEQFYGLEIDPKSDKAIVTDRNFCQAFALKANLDLETDPDTGEILGGTGAFLGFVLATETAAETPLILSTGTTAPLGATASPGDTFDLISDGCTSPAGCTVVTGSNGTAAATVTELTLLNTESGATVFHAKNVPYCTYKPVYCVDLLDPDYATANPGMTREQALDRLAMDDLKVVYRLPNVASDEYRPEAFAFNTTPVLPSEILERFDGIGTGPGQIPPLWILPDYMPSDADYFYEALFFITNAQTDDFTLELDVTTLQGYPSFSLTDGCELAAELPGSFSATEAGLERLLAWDVSNRVAERFPSVNGPQSADYENHQGTLVNFDCGSTRLKIGGFSLFPFNLMVSGCVGFYNADGDLVFDTLTSENNAVNCPLGDGDMSIPLADDSVFAKLYDKNYDELLQHLDELACTNVDTDNTGLAPLSQADCDSLRAIWANGKDKLVKALAATFQPKTSAGNENFGAVNSQLQNYLDWLRTAMPYGPDPASRKPEQIARVLSLQHLLNEKVLPSIPDNGFNDVDQSWAE